MHWPRIQLANESHQIGGMSGNRKVLPRVRPWGGTVVAEVVGHEPVLSGNGLSLWLPIAEVHPSTVNKDNWYARSLFDVEEIDTAHPKLMHHRFPSTALLGSNRVISN